MLLRIPLGSEESGQDFLGAALRQVSHNSPPPPLAVTYALTGKTADYDDADDDDDDKPDDGG